LATGCRSTHTDRFSGQMAVWTRLRMSRVCGRRGVRRSSSHLASLLDPLIQRLQHARVYGGDHIHRRIEIFFGHTRFPCVRKAAIHSRIAKPHHCGREIDEHLLALRRQTGSRLPCLHKSYGREQGWNWITSIDSKDRIPREQYRLWKAAGSQSESPVLGAFRKFL